MLDRFPPEICAHIFNFACRDSGYTGRSLSCVSRYISQTSKSARYMSIELRGRAQILAFAQLLEQAPTQLGTRYLFINGQESEAEMEKIVQFAYTGCREAQAEKSKLAKLLSPGDEKLKEAEDGLARQKAKGRLYLETFGREGANAVESILRNLAPTLEVLDISLNEYVAKMMLHTISLPYLMDLTTRCCFPLHPSDVPILEPTHSLRHLHVVEITDQWTWTQEFFRNGISYFAPSLTHLRLSQLEQDETVTDLEAALGLSVPDHRVTQLPSTIELVLIKPAVAPPPHVGCSCCDETVIYHDLVKSARQLRDRDHRVVLLQADGTSPAEDPYLQEWIDKVGGAACYWDTSRLDMAASD
ncbi:hypothetical protein MVEN_02035500 [Mycena venus]|uniref:Uncharacterized protein n=1 Tax=Mycena venus TaxID=2733690 RepID=A0A8H6XBP3_9AGAR|nr:hypothetical protein MVEN_02035500 [Mycena venus]